MQTQRRELNFKGQNVFIGIDLHLLSWTVSIFTEKLFNKKFDQPPRDCAKAANLLLALFPIAGQFVQRLLL